jgi:hypothetical protein
MALDEWQDSGIGRQEALEKLLETPAPRPQHHFVSV